MQIDPRLLAMLQGSQGSGLLPGPVPAPTLTPGFHPPGLMSTPGMQQRPQDPNTMGQAQGLMGALGQFKKPGGGGGGPSPFAGMDVSGMTPDQQNAAFSTYGNTGPSPFAGMDVSGMTPDQQNAAFSSYNPSGAPGLFSFLKGLF